MCQLQGFFEEYEGKLKPGAITAYFALNAEAEKWGTNSFFLSDEELLTRTGISSPKTLVKHLKKLESVGLIKLRRHHGRGLATDYVIKPLSSIGKPAKIDGFSNNNLDEKPVKFDGFTELSTEKQAKTVKKQVKNTTHHDHDDYEDDHDDFKDEKSKMIDVLHGMGVNGDSKRWVEILGVDRMRELIEIAMNKATTNPGGYLRVLVDQEILRGSTLQTEPLVALSVRDVKPGMIATHKRTGHQFRVKYAVGHSVVLEELDPSGNFGIDEADLKEYDFEETHLAAA